MNLNKKQKIIITGIAILIVISIWIVIVYFEKQNNYDYIEDVFKSNEIGEIEQETNKKPEPIEEKLIIHITGCVVSQGIVEVEKGARIIDVIEAAGGINDKADLLKVNLAYKVSDGQKIYIPSIDDEEKVEYVTGNSGNNVIIENNEKEGKSMVNINTATQTELETLPGIGPSTALKIIKYREENGSFKKIEDIQQVNGIGDAKFNGIKDQLDV